jgi:hypothetical protein
MSTVSKPVQWLVVATLIFSAYAAHEAWEASRYGGPYDSALEALTICGVCVALLVALVWYQRRAGDQGS